MAIASRQVSYIYFQHRGYMISRQQCLSKCPFHMEEKFVDYYEKLGVDPSSTYDDIKKSYHKLLKQIHPDKKSNAKCHEGKNKDFVDVYKAWSILNDNEKRAQYDQKFRENKLSSQDMIYDTIPKNELIPVQGENQYEYPCRCGGNFIFEEEDFQEEVDLTECDSCSLLLRLDCNI